MFSLMASPLSLLIIVDRFFALRESTRTGAILKSKNHNEKEPQQQSTACDLNESRQRPRDKRYKTKSQRQEHYT